MTKVAWVMQKTIGTTAAESLNTCFQVQMEVYKKNDDALHPKMLGWLQKKTIDFY